MPNALRHILPAALIAGAALATATPALAAGGGETNAHFAPSTYTVDESAGSATLTVARSAGLDQPATAYYYTQQPGVQNDAVPGLDFAPSTISHQHEIDFAAGQSTATITIPVVNHGMPEPTKYFGVQLTHSTAPKAQTVAEVQLTGEDPMPAVKNNGDPLALNVSGYGYPVGVATSASTHTPNSNPIAGSRLYVAPITRHTNLYPEPSVNFFLATDGSTFSYKPALTALWSQPQVMRFGTWDIASNGVDRTNVMVSNYLEKAQQQSPNTVPELMTYDLCHNSCVLPGSGKRVSLPVKACHQQADTGAQVAAFKNFINEFASGVSDHRAIVYLEMDGLITTGCLTHSGKQIRLDELSYAINTLSQLPRAAVYVDAGAADAASAQEMASDLNRIGVHKIQGFFLNSTHFDWTLNEIKYGQEISRLTRGAHFVVNTAVNGRGPELPADRVSSGNEVLCNPMRVGLGPKPTTDTGYADVDGFAWMGTAGISDASAGGCASGGLSGFTNIATGTYSPQYAELLIHNANYSVRGTVPSSSVKTDTRSIAMLRRSAVRAARVAAASRHAASRH